MNLEIIGRSVIVTFSRKYHSMSLSNQEKLTTLHQPLRDTLASLGLIKLYAYSMASKKEASLVSVITIDPAFSMASDRAKDPAAHTAPDNGRTILVSSKGAGIGRVSIVGNNRYFAATQLWELIVYV